MLKRRIERLAFQILEKFQIDELPVPVDQIAKKMGLEIQPYDLGENVSGVLVIDKGKGTIGFNNKESKVRKRFTIAHELGHYVVHYANNGIFIDKNFKIEFRDQESSTGELLKEQEANAFAAAILMPEKFLIREIEARQLDLSDDGSLNELAKTFNVSTTAMSFRLANLNLF